MLSFTNIHVPISEKDERRARAKTAPNMENSYTRWFRGKVKGKHTVNGKSGASAYYGNFTSADDCDHDENVQEPADADQAHNDRLNLEVTTGKKLWTMIMVWKNHTFSSYVALDDVTAYEAAALDAIARFGNDLDPEVSAQLIQANA